MHARESKGEREKKQAKCPRDSLLGAGRSSDDGTYGSKSEYEYEGT